MSGKAKPKPRAAFDDNMADAETLLKLAKALQNRRVRRMRKELRTSIGAALHIPARSRRYLDRINSDSVFGVLLPGSSLRRDDFSEPALRPMLRQALVAGCAAVETFVADRVMERIGGTLRLDDVPADLRAVPMTIGDWLTIEATYERRQWGVRPLIEKHVANLASPSPSQIGQLFNLVGESNLWRRVNRRRALNPGDSEAELDRIYERRNRIAHAGDRVGRGRATITPEEVEGDLACLATIVDALDKETVAPAAPRARKQ